MSWLQLQSALAVLAFVAGNSYPPIKPSVHYDYPDIPWPLPSQLHHHGSGVTILSPRLTLDCGVAMDGCDPDACAMPGTIIGRAFDRARGRLSPKAAAPAKPGELVVHSLLICVHQPPGHDPGMPVLETNESYTLNVPGPAVSLTGSAAPAASTSVIDIHAPEVYGVLWALESLGHLVSFQSVGRIRGTPIDIADTPAYPVRGLMVNAAEQFMPISMLQRAVDGMALNKMNFLHVHWSDITSFPVNSEKFPKLAAGGRLAAMQNDSALPATATTYSLDELRAFVTYAADRGVRVCPEFDMPGHGSWQFGMPELCLSSCPNVLDVTKDELYTFLVDFLAEMATVFSDPVMHLGGDEVGCACLNASGQMMLNGAFDLDPSAAAWMKAHNMSSADVTDYFWKRVAKEVIPKVNKTLQVWYAPTFHTGDPPVTQMPKTTIADSWGGIDFAADACKAGYRVVVSTSIAPASNATPGSGWYLPPFGDCRWPGAWARDIEAELDALGCDAAARKKFLLGGSVAAWSGDASIFDYTVWEGTMAVAERLWSGQHGLTRPPTIAAPEAAAAGASAADDGLAPRTRGKLGGLPPLPDWLKEVTPRLAVHTCHMKMRGYTVSPYRPSTYTMGGLTAWCVGGSNRGGLAPRNATSYVAECAPCPADWGWDQ